MFRTIALIGALFVIGACAPKSHSLDIQTTHIDYSHFRAYPGALYDSTEFVGQKSQDLRMAVVRESEVHEGIMGKYSLREASDYEMRAFIDQHPSIMRVRNRVCAAGTQIPVKRNRFHLTPMYEYPVVSAGTYFGVGRHCYWRVVVEK
jgi:hypothetical protein